VGLYLGVLGEVVEECDAQVELLGLGELADGRADADQLVRANVGRLAHELLAAVVHDIAVQTEAVLVVWTRHQVLHIATNAVPHKSH
jgi:hypothetical protein